MTTQKQPATITSAVELTKAEKDEILSMLTRMTGTTDLDVEYVVNPEVLGGLRIEAGDWMLDTTISHHLVNLSHQLMNRS